jgi:hypothetical protein
MSHVVVPFKDIVQQKLTGAEIKVSQWKGLPFALNRCSLNCKEQCQQLKPKSVAYHSIGAPTANN